MFGVFFMIFIILIFEQEIFETNAMALLSRELTYDAFLFLTNWGIHNYLQA